MWLVFTVTLVFAVVAGFWLARQDHAPLEPTGPEGLRALIMAVVGGFLIVAGVLGYLVVILTTGLTFNFTRPVWTDLKGKIFAANIFVPMLPAIGLALALSPLLTPVLGQFGVDADLANLLPLLAAVIAVQFAQLFVLIWAPLERRFITRRLLAQGITPAQLQMGVMVGLSNPASGFAKRFALIEEDMGALWLSDEQLVYWGDSERFALTRDQISQIERRADARSTTMLWGISHVILHTLLPEGGDREVRLHVEGLWTMAEKRRAMDRLAEQIMNWHSRS